MCVAVDAEQAGGRVFGVGVFVVAVVAVSEGVGCVGFLRVYGVAVGVEDDVTVLISPYQRGEAIVQVVWDVYGASAFGGGGLEELFQGIGRMFRGAGGGGNGEGEAHRGFPFG